ncbi:MAG: hypothetical protein DMG58_19700 [Acidobacteria bacterium]|nr:MAG: hypothetical protein DMG58_19700 [Acidobacteriota bacterium]
MPLNRAFAAQRPFLKVDEMNGQRACLEIVALLGWLAFPTVGWAQEGTTTGESDARGSCTIAVCRRFAPMSGKFWYPWS